MKHKGKDSIKWYKNQDGSVVVVVFGASMFCQTLASKAFERWHEVGLSVKMKKSHSYPRRVQKWLRHLSAHIVLPERG